VVARVLELPEGVAPGAPATTETGSRPAATLFSTAPVLACEDLDADTLAKYFGDDRRHAEMDHGVLLSFFSGAHRHVVLRVKERRILRPHGHILRTGDHLVPDEASLTSTAWMDGVFHSLVTQGHVNINRVLSTSRSYLGLFRAHGLRIFVESAAGWQLLGVPSAFAMTPGGCRWLYQSADGLVAVESRAATRVHELGLAIDVLAGPPRRFLLSHHVTFGGDDGADPAAVRVERDAAGIVVRTDPETDFGRRFPDGLFRFDPVADTALERVAGDEALFLDGRSRREPYLVVVTAPCAAAAFRITGGLTATPALAGDRGVTAADEDAAEVAFWAKVAGTVTVHAPVGAPEVARAGEILPWFAHDALVHYLAPRGLEQYSGGGWGTRDVCQGPVELLLALGLFAPLRDLLLRVFATQNPEGDWPQGSRSSRATAASVPATRTATSSFGRYWRSPSICSPPRTGRCSTSRCPSSIPRATPPPSTPAWAPMSGARSR